MENKLGFSETNFQEVNVKAMPSETLNTIQNSVLRRIAKSVNSPSCGAEHQNHNSGGGHSSSR